MNKILTIAAREYKSSVKTKSFIITLVFMPLLMGTSAGVQIIFKRQSESEAKRFAVIDRTPGAKVYPLLKAAADERNQKQTVDSPTGKKSHADFLLESISPSEFTPDAVSNQRLEVSQQVEENKYWGFVDIGPDVIPSKQNLFRSLTATSANGKSLEPGKEIRYQTNHPTFESFPSWLDNEMLLSIVTLSSGMSREALLHQERPTVQREGLSKRDPVTGNIIDPPLIHQIARFLVPAVLVGLMFMIVMLSSTPAMQGVLEEKMQRIAEVLLGSVRPFELMLGKLMGLMGVSLTVAAVYLAGAYWAAYHYGFTEFLPLSLLVWFVLFQALAVVMFGSAYLAIGSAATESKETQSLAMPVILIACIPMFILSTALEDPNNPMVVAFSFFPPVTPMLMMARLAIPPGPVWWQPFLGILLVLAVTGLCVYAAGRIFRVGILMQGKGAKLSQMVQWIFRG